MWLDNQFQTKPLITIILLVGSVPVTLFVMMWIVRKGTARIKTASKKDEDNSMEDANRGTNE
jgi:hypothetical protein